MTVSCPHCEATYPIKRLKGFDGLTSEGTKATMLCPLCQLDFDVHFEKRRILGVPLPGVKAVGHSRHKRTR
jgi:hypothetical protein